MKATNQIVTHRLKIIRGQVRGIGKMLEDNRTPADIRVQVDSIRASLRQVEILLLAAELDGDRERAALLQKAVEHI